MNRAAARAPTAFFRQRKDELAVWAQRISPAPGGLSAREQLSHTPVPSNLPNLGRNGQRPTRYGYPASTGPKKPCEKSECDLPVGTGAVEDSCAGRRCGFCIGPHRSRATACDGIPRCSFCKFMRSV